jgi:hypothetical protein
MSEKFDGDQLCYGLSDLDLMVVDVHLNLSEKLNESVPKSLMDICFLWLVKSRFDGRM